MAFIDDFLPDEEQGLDFVLNLLAEQDSRLKADERRVAQLPQPAPVMGKLGSILGTPGNTPGQAVDADNPQHAQRPRSALVGKVGKTAALAAIGNAIGGTVSGTSGGTAGVSAGSGTGAGAGAGTGAGSSGFLSGFANRATAGSGLAAEPSLLSQFAKHAQRFATAPDRFVNEGLSAVTRELSEFAGSKFASEDDDERTAFSSLPSVDEPFSPATSALESANRVSFFDPEGDGIGLGNVLAAPLRVIGEARNLIEGRGGSAARLAAIRAQKLSNAAERFEISRKTAHIARKEALNVLGLDRDTADAKLDKAEERLVTSGLNKDVAAAAIRMAKTAPGFTETVGEFSTEHLAQSRIFRAAAMNSDIPLPEVAEILSQDPEFLKEIYNLPASKELRQRITSKTRKLASAIQQQAEAGNSVAASFFQEGSISEADLIELSENPPEGLIIDERTERLTPGEADILRAIGGEAVGDPRVITDEASRKRRAASIKAARESRQKAKDLRQGIRVTDEENRRIKKRDEPGVHFATGDPDMPTVTVERGSDDEKRIRRMGAPEVSSENVAKIRLEGTTGPLKTFFDGKTGRTRLLDPESTAARRPNVVELEGPMVSARLRDDPDGDVFRIQGDHPRLQEGGDLVHIPTGQIEVEGDLSTLGISDSDREEAAAGALKRTGPIVQIASMLDEIDAMGPNAFGLRGAGVNALAGIVAQLRSPETAETFSRWVTESEKNENGVGPRRLAAFQLRAYRMIAQAVPEITAETSGRVTDKELALSGKALKLLDPFADAEQIRGSLMALQSLKIADQDLDRQVAGLDPVYDLETAEGALGMRKDLLSLGMDEREAKETVQLLRQQRQRVDMMGGAAQYLEARKARVESGQTTEEAKALRRHAMEVNEEFLSRTRKFGLVP
jgi:hypothetical protein